MRKTFEEALNDLLNEYSDEDREEVVSALELALMAQKEQLASDCDAS